MSDTILVIDDDQDVLNIISTNLTLDGYRINLAKSGREGLRLAKENKPSLIILDVMMPDMDGFSVCRNLRQDPITKLIPILFLTAKDRPEDRVLGLDLGGDDYVGKPFDWKELAARIRAQLRRVKQQKSINPLTSLPGNLVIEEEIKRLIELENYKFAVLYLDIDNFKPYNDVYGFLQGDEVIKMLAKIMTDLREEAEYRDIFLGHIGGDDFIIISPAKDAEEIARKIIDKFERKVKFFYSEKDLELGFITTVDRQGKLRHFPMLSLSIGIVTNENRDITSHWQIGEIGAEVKRYAKSLPGSVYWKDRRKE